MSYYTRNNLAIAFRQGIQLLEHAYTAVLHLLQDSEKAVL